MASVDVEFDRFIEAIAESAPEADAQQTAVTHTASVTPRDWERVQQQLD